MHVIINLLVKSVREYDDVTVLMYVCMMKFFFLDQNFLNTPKNNLQSSFICIYQANFALFCLFYCILSKSMILKKSV